MTNNNERRRISYSNLILSRKENGVALVMFAILLVAIMGGLALGIDIFIASSSKSQHHHTAEQAVLAAMKTYIDSSGDHKTKLKKAAKSASNIATANEPNWLGSSFFKDPSLPQGIVGIPGVPRPNGELRPGIWHFEDPGCSPSGGYVSDPTLSPSCPCDSTGTFVKQCFEQIGVKDKRANALRIHLKLNSASPLKTLFAKVIGTDSVTFSSEATVAEIPRRGVFLADMSLSVVDDTHHLIKTSPSGTKYDFEFSHLPKDKKCSALHSLGTIQKFWLPEYFVGSVSRNGWKNSRMLVGLPTTPPPGSPSYPSPPMEPEYKHVPSAYQCVKGDQSYGDSRDVPDYVIEPTKKPEPFTSIVNAIHVALKEFEKRAIASDRVGIVAFDDSVDYSRATTQINSITGLPEFSLIKPIITEPEFKRWSLATDITKDIDVRLDTNSDGKIDLMLFPKAIGSTTLNYKLWLDYRGPHAADLGYTWKYLNKDIPGGTVEGFFDEDGVYKKGEWALKEVDQPPMTDLKLALITAYNMLGGVDTLKIAENFVVLFSDGKSTCQYGPGYVDTVDLEDKTPKVFADMGFMACAQRESRCFGNQYFFNNSMNLINGVIDKYEDVGIKFNMVLVGDSVAPHTLLYSGEEKCLGDFEARALDKSFVDDTGSVYKDPVFYSPNKLWNKVKQTHGLWIPIRKPCDKTGGGNDISEDLNALCDGAGTVNELMLTGDITSDILSKTGRESKDEILDSKSRLLCDPQSRGTKEQMEEAINKIMGEIPYVLVEEVG